MIECLQIKVECPQQKIDIDNGKMSYILTVMSHSVNTCAIPYMYITVGSHIGLKISFKSMIVQL